MNCLSQQQLVRLTLDPINDASLVSHCRECPECRANLEKMQSLTKQLVEVHSRFDDSNEKEREQLLALVSKAVRPAASSRFWNRFGRSIEGRSRIRRIATGGVGVIVLLAIVLLWECFNTSPLSAMEQMAENIRRAKSCQVTMTMEVQLVSEPGKEPVTSKMIMKTSWLAPRSYRNDFSGGPFAAGPGTTDIILPASPGIHLDHKAKTFSMRPPLRGIPSLLMLDQLGNFSGHADRELGTKKIDGIDAIGFQIDGKKIDTDAYPGPVEIWLDRETKLPILVRYEMRSPATSKPMIMRMEDFHWNIDLDPKLFVAEPPVGYVKEEKNSVEYPGPEKVRADIVLALKTYAELCGGRYPQITRSFGEPVRDAMYKGAGLSYPPTVVQSMHDKNYRRVFDAFQGFAVFNRVIRDNPDVAYYGKTVGSADKDKVLLRWKLEDGSYQIIFGDLRCESVAPERLRTLEQR
jgi:hypothetical protein